MTYIRTAVPLLALVGLALAGERALAQDTKAPEAKPNQIQIEYIAPKDKDLMPVYQRVKERQMLEKFQQFLSPFRLPRPLLLKFQDCDGELNAWYQNYTVTTCYEYIAEVIKNAPKRKGKAGVTPQDAVVGPAIEVVLHEVGHAIYYMLNIPILGRGEDAADQFASYILLNFGKDEARRLIGGIAIMYARDAKEERAAAKKESKGMKAFAGEHGLAAQRFFNILCMAYGAYPEVFQDVVDKGYLPKERAKRCGGEFKQAQHAIRTLVRPHLDPTLLEEVSHRHWVAPASDAK